MIAFFNGRFLPKSEIAISPDDRGFLLGDGVYDVLCAYHGEPFEADAHFERLRHSLLEIRMATPTGGIDEIIYTLQEAIPELLHRNDLLEAHAKIYLQVTRGAAARQHAFPEGDVSPTAYGTATPYRPPLEQWEEGVAAILHPDLRWSRCDIKSVSLLPAVLASQRAREAGAYEALLVRDGVITEGSHSTVMAVFDGTVVTHPLTQHILPGITRAVILELCRAHDVPVREEPIEADYLQNAEELIVVGTTTGVMPVLQVDDWPVGVGRPGPITRVLQEAFLQRAGLEVAVGGTS